MLQTDVSSEIRTFASGAVLFRQGDRPAGLFKVEAGAVRLERSTYDGHKVVIHTSRTGQFLAEASLFSDRYHCDAVAIEQSTVRFFLKEPLLEAVKADPVSDTSLLAEMARQLQSLRHQLELRGIRSARDRLLLLLETRAGPDGSVRLPNRIQDLAFELGLSREVVYRTLSALERTV